MNITGKLIVIFDTIQVSESFRKRPFVVETVDGEYSELLQFEFIQDKCDFLDSYSIGQQVTVDFNLKGRKWTNPQGEVKYFNTLQAWRINAETQQEPAQQVYNDGAPMPDMVHTPKSEGSPDAYPTTPLNKGVVKERQMPSDAINDVSDIPF